MDADVGMATIFCYVFNGKATAIQVFDVGYRRFGAGK